MLDLARVVEHHTFAGFVFAFLAQIIKTKHDILRRHDDRLAVGGAEDVVGGHHQHARFELRFERQGNVHGHLVAVEIRVEGSAD